MKKLVSIVVPIYNEEAGITNFLRLELLPAIKKNKSSYRFEIILVNDGSTDTTYQKLLDFCKHRRNFHLISFTRNFGKEIALTAGYQIASGDAVITIDADGQQPASLLPDFLKAWQSGAKVVTGVRKRYTKHGIFKRLGSKLFYWLLRKMGNHSVVPGGTDFRLLDRIVVNDFLKLTEHHRLTRGLIDWLGYSEEYIYYDYAARKSGKPTQSLSKLFFLAIDTFVSLSTTPLIFFGFLGIIISVLSFGLGSFCIINQYLLDDPLHLYWNGAVQMTIFVTFLIGLLFISQAITALYISHIHAEAQGRPLFVLNYEKCYNYHYEKVQKTR